MTRDEVWKWAEAAGFTLHQYDVAAQAVEAMKQSDAALLAFFALLVFTRRGASVRPPHPPAATGPRFDLRGLRLFAANAGFPPEEVDTAAAIAMAESDGYQYAQGDPHGTFGPVPNGTSTSFGLWQIHTPVHRQYNASKLLQDASYNARAAFEIRSTPEGFRHWSTFNRGPHGEAPEYLKYMPTA